MKSKLSHGLIKLVSTKQTRHFKTAEDNFVKHADSRKNYLEKFSEAMVLDLARA